MARSILEGLRPTASGVETAPGATRALRREDTRPVQDSWLECQIANLLLGAGGALGALTGGALRFDAVV